MTTLVRAALNVSHTDVYLHAARAFVHTVIPPLILGLVALTAVLFSFTYVDPVTKKPTLRASIFRLGMGLVSICSFYDFGFGHFLTYDENVSRQVRDMCRST
jgi:hypothetical protein